MKYEIIRTETMRLVGFAARTNNGAPDCGAVIGSLWQKYFKAFGYARASYCVYTDYAGDETDDYTAFVGCEGDALPSGGRAVEIPAGLYVAFSLACTTENAARRGAVLAKTLDGRIAPRLRRGFRRVRRRRRARVYPRE